ncbi:MAG: hypothetical protein J5773_05660, partial [Verrucomicrobia bacterium]|nr:hypothetical protein [Verrucomicrobiota bacterium]
MAPLPKGGCQTPISREAADWGIFIFHSSFFIFHYLRQLQQRPGQRLGLPVLPVRGRRAEEQI